jgi:hypothetical protein
MDEMREEAKDMIRFYVWGGWHSPREVFDIIDEEVFDCDGENDKWLRSAIEKEFDKKLEKEKTWPKLTTFDRLDQAFTALRKQGILAQHRCGLTQQDGLEVVEDLYKEEGGKKSGITGHFYYTHEDMEGAMEGADGLLLAFGSFSKGSAAEVGRLIKHEMEKNGFKVVWDGTEKTRLLLSGFRWQKRSPRRKSRTDQDES